MTQIFTDNWALMNFSILLALTCAQMVVVYAMIDANNPPAGLGLYTVFFMASLMGWIAYLLQQGSLPDVGVDVTMVAAILNSFILYMAAGQRSGDTRGRTVLGAVCMGAILCVFFFPPDAMLLILSGTIGISALATALLCLQRSVRERNVGDGIIAVACTLLSLGMAASASGVLAGLDSSQARDLQFALHGVYYALVVVGFLASVLIEFQQQLSQLSTRDPLTRLPNRRGLDESLHLTLAAAARHAHSTAAVLVDIDHFKTINGTFGHEIGDRVIQQIARALEHICRNSDVVARTGGDEFLIILPNTDLESARVLAERVRESLADYPILVDQQRIALSLSLGVSAAIGEVDIDALYDDVDKALYTAKQGGRNRVVSVNHRPLQMNVGNRQA